MKVLSHNESIQERFSLEWNFALIAHFDEQISPNNASDWQINFKDAAKTQSDIITHFEEKISASYTSNEQLHPNGTPKPKLVQRIDLEEQIRLNNIIIMTPKITNWS
jgi:hypothetical protein